MNPKSLELLAFRQPFDGTQPELNPKQKAAAVQAFAELFDMLGRAHAFETTAKLGDQGLWTGRTTWFELSFADDSSLTGDAHEDTVAGVTDDEPDTIHRSITLIAYDSVMSIDEDGVEDDFLSEINYEFYSEVGVVVRDDDSAFSFIKRLAERSPDVTQQDDFLNRAMQVDLGMDSQPVTAEEIVKLGELLMMLETEPVGYGKSQED